jgi:TP901 family phage tail tape measure protein
LAGSQKEFELLFKLKAALGPNFNGAFKSAINTNNQLRDSMKNVNSLQSKIDGYTKQSAAIDKNKERLALLNAEHDRLQQELQQTGEPTDALRKKLERNESQIQQTTAKIQEQERQLNSYAEELREAGVNTDNLEEANGRLQKSYEKLQSSQQTLQKINEKQQQVQQSISKTKGQLLGTIGAIGAIATAVYAGPVQAAQKYETAIAKVGTIADTQEVPLGTLSQQIMQLSNQTGIAASAVADDVYNAISAGQKTADAVNFVTNSTKLAKAGFAESSQTLDVLTTVLNAYGMSADKVGTVSDMLVQTQNKGKVTVGELASSMGKIIPTANASNVSLEQLCAGYAIMTSKGIAAAETTTYMNSMLNELSKSGSTTDKLLREKMGGSFSELMKSGKSLGEILGGIQDEASKSGLALSDMFSSSEAGKAAMSLLSNGVDGFNASVQDMVNSVGATDSAFAKMEDTTEAKMEKAKNSIANLSIVLGQNLLPIVGNMADKVATVVTKVSEFAAANPKLVQTVLKVAAGLAALKAGMLTTKLVTLSAEDGILSLAKKLVGLRAGFIENAATSAGFAAKLKAAGSGVLSYFGNVKGALGGVGSAIGNIFSGNTVKTVLGPLGNLAKTALGPLGGIAGKILPVVGVITTIITVIKLVQTHLEEIRSFIQRTFGDEALAVFDKIVAVITNVGNTIKNVFSGENIGAARDKIQELFGDKGAAVFDTFVNVLGTVKNAVSEVVGFITANVVPVAEQVLQVITTQVIPGIVSFIQAAAPTIMQIIQSVADFIGAIIPVIGSFIAGLMPIISEIITFISTYVLPIISELFSFICSTVLPAISDAIQAILPVVQNVLQTLLPAIQTALSTIWNIVSPIIQGILAAVQFVMPTIQAIVQSGVQAISGVISGIVTVLNGIITFITGVFSGNWRQAWEGIKSIFSGIWQAIKSVCTGAINGIISAVNTAIRGLNKVKVPDWVPGVGGKGINISEIPMLAKGSSNTPDTFIAGEAGPELITNAPGRTVFTASQTRSIMAAQNTAATTAAAVAPTTAPTTTAQTVNNYNTAPEVTAGAGNNGGGAKNVTINNNPTIVVNGDKPEDLDAKLEENNKRLLRDVEELLDEKEDKERRQKYD